MAAIRHLKFDPNGNGAVRFAVEVSIPRGMRADCPEKDTGTRVSPPESGKDIIFGQTLQLVGLWTGGREIYG